MKAGVIAQFLADGDWTGVDLIVVDCPPGTGDEPLTVAQLIPDADGVVVVTQPQDVSLLDSRKCVNFVKMLKLPVLGIVENMSGFVCPHCGEHLDMFSIGGGQKAAAQMNVPFLGAIPMTLKMVGAGDTGRPIVESVPDDPAAKALGGIADRIVQEWDKIATARARARTTRVVVAADSTDGLKAKVSSQFAKAAAFIVVEVEEGKVNAVRSVPSPFVDGHQSGQIPRYIHDDLDGQVIITGEMGSHAFDAFHSYNMEVVVGAGGTVVEVVKSWIISHATACTPEKCAGCSSTCPSGHAHEGSDNEQCC